MSVVPTSAPAAPAAPEGLEDFDRSDMVMPRLDVVGKEGVFQDSLSKQKYTELEVILLGLVKNRILWPPSYSGEKAMPLCRSLDAKLGLPGEKFPWEASGFVEAEHPDGLACDSCPLKDWGSHPTTGNDTPWCSEQYVFPLLMKVESGEFAPALLTFQRSGIKPSNTYISSFARSGSPLFTATTKLKLNRLTRGQVDYSVPEFARGEATDEKDFAEYASLYRSIRTMLQTPRDEKAEAEKAAAPGEPVASPTPASPQGAAAVAPEDDLPF